MGYNKRHGFTLIELVMVIAIIGILSVSGAHLMAYLVQNSVFIPNKLNMDMAASSALDIMIEGDSSAKGLRFSRSISSVADSQVVFNNQDNQTISYSLDTGTNKLYRSISLGAEAPIPYYITSGVNVTAPSNKLFTYYDSSGTETANAADVRRIKLTLTALIGSGSYSDWQASSLQSSSIKVSKFE